MPNYKLLRAWVTVGGSQPTHGADVMMAKRRQSRDINLLNRLRGLGGYWGA